MDAGQPLGDKIRGAFVFLCGRLRGGGIRLGRLRQVRDRTRYDQHLLQLMEIGIRLDVNQGVRRVLRIECHRGDHSHGQAPRKDLVPARGDHLFAGLDAVVGGEIADHHLPRGRAAQNAAQPGGGQKDPRPGVRIIQ